MKHEKDVQIGMYMKSAEFDRVAAIAAKRRRSVSDTMRVLFEDAVDQRLSVDLSKREKLKDEKRANMCVTQGFKEKLDAYKSASEGLSMSEILMRVVEAYELNNQ